MKRKDSKKFYLNAFILATITAIGINCEHTTEPPQAPAGGTNIFVAYDEPPKPINGFSALQQDIRYPEEALRLRIEGRVIVQVLVDSTGEVIDVIIVRSLGHGCDQEAMRVILSQQWTPAHQRDRPVKVWVNIPVVFRLPNDK